MDNDVTCGNKNYVLHLNREQMSKRSINTEQHSFECMYIIASQYMLYERLAHPERLTLYFHITYSSCNTNLL